jgi:hypothetical protein
LTAFEFKLRRYGENKDKQLKDKLDKKYNNEHQIDNEKVILL